MNTKKVLYYSDATFTDNDTMVLGCGFLAAPEAATSRILLNYDDGWASHDVPDDFIVSVTYSTALGELFALGKNGLVKRVGQKNVPFTYENNKGNWREVWIPGVDAKGNLTKIKAIGNSVFVCGWGSQIYQLEDGVWVDIFAASGLMGRVAILDIDGLDEKNLYAVGLDGVVLHYDGVKWERGDLGTNCNLYFILSTSDKKLLTGGASGTLFLCQNGAWYDISEEDVTSNVWSAAEFDSEIYIVTSKTLKKYNLKYFSDIDFGLDVKPSIYKLCSSSTKLCSIGEYDLALFDGVNWNLVTCPE